jgi:hypothetical protein
MTFPAACEAWAWEIPTRHGSKGRPGGVSKEAGLMSDPISSIQAEFIPASAEAVFDVFNDVEGWPRWAVHHIKSVARNADGTFSIQTPHRAGVLRLKTERTHGILDYEFTDPKVGTWLVCGRVAPFANGALVSLNFGKQPGVSDDEFSKGMALVKEELKKLRQLLEATPSRHG